MHESTGMGTGSKGSSSCLQKIPSARDSKRVLCGPGFPLFCSQMQIWRCVEDCSKRRLEAVEYFLSSGSVALCIPQQVSGCTRILQCDRFANIRINAFWVCKMCFLNLSFTGKEPTVPIPLWSWLLSSFNFCWPMKCRKAWPNIRFSDVVCSDQMDPWFRIGFDNMQCYAPGGPNHGFCTKTLNISETTQTYCTVWPMLLMLLILLQISISWKWSRKWTAEHKLKRQGLKTMKMRRCKANNLRREGTSKGEQAHLTVLNIPPEA